MSKTVLDVQTNQALSYSTKTNVGQGTAYCNVWSLISSVLPLLQQIYECKNYSLSYNIVTYKLNMLYSNVISL